MALVALVLTPISPNPMHFNDNYVSGADLGVEGTPQKNSMTVMLRCRMTHPSTPPPNRQSTSDFLPVLQKNLKLLLVSRILMELSATIYLLLVHASAVSSVRGILGHS